MSGIYKRPSTHSTIAVLHGQIIGECADDLPEQAKDMWLGEILRRLPPDDLVEILL